MTRIRRGSKFISLQQECANLYLKCAEKDNAEIHILNPHVVANAKFLKTPQNFAKIRILIYFANPYKEGTLDGKFKMEIEYLRERGYTFIQIGNGLFEAVKK